MNIVIWLFFSFVALSSFLHYNMIRISHYFLQDFINSKYFKIFPCSQNCLSGSFITGPKIPWNDCPTRSFQSSSRSAGCLSSDFRKLQSAKSSAGLCFAHTNGCILIGLHAEPMLETGMRLTPGERQSGDGTSLPETPNNLTNVRTVARPRKKTVLNISRVRGLTLVSLRFHHTSCQQCTLNWRTCTQPRGPSLWRVVLLLLLKVCWIWSLPHAQPPLQYMLTQVAQRIDMLQIHSS